MKKMIRYQRREKSKWQRWGTLFLAAAMLALLVSGCAAPAHDEAAPDYREAPATAPEAEREESPEEDAVSEIQQEVEAPEGRRYIIRNARLTLEIQDMDETVQQLQVETEQMNGYVSSLEIYSTSEERRAGHIILRIPVEQFDEALEMIKGLGKIQSEQFDTDDVTRQYIDMEARIANLEVQEQRLRDLLERAETVEDVLKVESELGRIRGDLESKQGEFKHLQEQVRYSTFQVRLQERDPRTQVVADGGVNWEQLGDLFILNTNRLFNGVSSFFIWFLGSLPILIPLGGGAFLGWKLVVARKKRKTKRKEEQQAG